MPTGFHLCVAELKDVPESRLESMESSQLEGESDSIYVVEILSRRKKNWLRDSNYSRFRGRLQFTYRYHQDHHKWFETEIAALKAKEIKMDELENQGHNVLQNNPNTYSVYLVDLDSAAMDVPRFNSQNQDLGYTPVRYLYIGQTNLMVEERYEAHKTRPSGSNIVRDHGIGLAEDLIEEYGQSNLTKVESLELEAALSQNLRNPSTRFATYSK